MAQKDSCVCWICGGYEKSKDNISKWCCYGIGANCFDNNEKRGCCCWICGGMSYNNINYDYCTTIPPFFHYQYCKSGNETKENLILYWGLGGFFKQKIGDTTGWCMSCCICPFYISRGKCISYSYNENNCSCCDNKIDCYTKCFNFDECCNVDKNKYQTIQYLCLPFGCIESILIAYVVLLMIVIVYQQVHLKMVYQILILMKKIYRHCFIYFR